MKVTGNRKTEPSAHEVARVPLIVERNSDGKLRKGSRVVTAVGSASPYTIGIVRMLIIARLV